ncbi:MAG: DUF4221 family protein [Algoriphagus sp.]|uniref:DUF4221 family protein n=1 Tax=Algoriphagus sp. TaxID=1872435 RepID=UPI002611A81C|nr:DUF4221 family protein [Algoriphagus sp.]MDG1277921.1 DUF4221 family protein [Algoriphagus sp.]
MKNLLIPSLVLFFFSCGGNSESDSNSKINLLENLQTSIDTVLISVGDEIFNPGAYYAYDLSEDGKRIFYGYSEGPEVHEISLEDYALIARHKFSTDGPDRAPSFINYLSVLTGDDFALIGYGTQGIYSKNGKKIQSLDIEKTDWKGLEIEGNLNLIQNLRVLPDKNRAVSTPSPFARPVEGLAVFDLENESIKLHKLPALEITNKFNVTFRQENGGSSSGDFIDLQKLRDDFVIYSASTSDIYLYQPDLDSLRLITFDHKLVPKQKTGDFPTEVDSNERRMEVSNEIRKQISFSRLFWDESRNIYWRFAMQNPRYTEERRYLGSEVFVFTYDQDFKLTGETLSENLTMLTNLPFMKDGKLYGLTVLKEDPAFVVISFNF